MTYDMDFVSKVHCSLWTREKKKNKSCSTRLKSKSRLDVWRDTFNTFARFFLFTQFFFFFTSSSVRIHAAYYEFNSILFYIGRNYLVVWFKSYACAPLLAKKSFLFLAYANWSIRIFRSVIQSIDFENVYLLFKYSYVSWTGTCTLNHWRGNKISPSDSSCQHD